jgi:hypothetical protein
VSLFALGYIIWLLWQKNTSIDVLCVRYAYFVGLVIINAAWLRINAAELPVGKVGRARAYNAVHNNYDLVLWGVIMIMVTTIVIIAQQF